MQKKCRKSSFSSQYHHTAKQDSNNKSTACTQHQYVHLEAYIKKARSSEKSQLHLVLGFGSFLHFLEVPIFR